MPARVFLLSPASCGGQRARLLMSPRAAFPLAGQVRDGGAPLREVFSFLSGLYFRGKVRYVDAFARPVNGEPGARVVTAGEGLLPLEATTTLARLEGWARVPIDLAERRYLEPFERDARALRERLGPRGEVVLLGSVASGKYVEVLLPLFGERLLFPREFVGRGDMSRGGLMLRAAASGEELAYVPVEGTPRRGVRPPRLAPVKGILSG